MWLIIDLFINLNFFFIMEKIKMNLCEFSKEVRGELKTYLMDENLDKSLKPAIQSIISACLQLEFIVFVQSQDDDLDNGLRDDAKLA